MSANSSLVQSNNGQDDVKKVSIIPRIIAGSIGSIITALAVTPLEVVKVRQQASLGSPLSISMAKSKNTVSAAASAKRCPDCGVFFLNNGLMECMLPKKSVPFFNPVLSSNATGTVNGTQTSIPKEQSYGTFRLLRSIFRKEGLSGIYAGLSPTLVMSVPNTVLYFTSYDELSSRFRQYSNQYEKNHTYVILNDILNPLLCGSAARLLSTIVTSPLELIRTRQASRIAVTPSLNSAVSTSPYQSPPLLKEIQMMIRAEGILSLYKGLAPTLYRDVPFSAIYWLCLERFKTILNQHNENLDMNSDLTPLMASTNAFISGAFSGMIAAFFTTPFDVVKTRQQMDLLQQVASEEKAKFDLSKSKKTPCSHHYHNQNPREFAKSSSTWAQIREIASTEGASGLWRGNQTRMIKIAPACAIMISCYEFGKRILERS